MGTRCGNFSNNRRAAICNKLHEPLDLKTLPPSLLCIVVQWLSASFGLCLRADTTAQTEPKTTNALVYFKLFFSLSKFNLIWFIRFLFVSKLCKKSTFLLITIET